MTSKGKHLAKITAICFAIFASVGILAIGVYFTMAYFFKAQENKGYIRFAPGIYLEFNPQTVKIDEEDTSNWKLKYYAQNDLESEPVDLNTENEPASPMKEYFVLSPEFKLSADANGNSATVVARAKLQYTLLSDNSELSQENVDYLFDETLEGSRLTLTSSWVKYGEWYYYVGNNNVEEITSASDLEEIEYSQNAEYISVFETNNNNVAVIKMANQSIENYQSNGYDSFNIILTIEFVESANNWLN